MQKVIVINLNGNAYQLDESGFALLRAYLDRAEVQLKDNPDRAEIISDLEQAIADKCHRVLGPQKTVVSTAEVQQIIEEMGPVDAAAGETTDAQAADEGPKDRPRTEGSAAKRLYQIRQGAMISGVCQGLAAYFGIDVTIVRIVFVVLAVITKGAFAVAYFVLMFVIPHARTSEERAAAHGQPFNAQELIDEAKRNYARMHGNREWRKQWRRQHREWRRHVWPMGGHFWGMPWVPWVPMGYTGQILAGIMLPLLTILRVGMFWVWIFVLASLLGTNTFFGWPLPDNVPFWEVLLFAAFAYAAIAWPLHAAQRASHYALGTHAYGWISAWNGLVGFAVSVAFLWFAWAYIPEVHDVLENLPVIRDNIRALFSELKS